MYLLASKVYDNACQAMVPEDDRDSVKDGEHHLTIRMRTEGDRVVLSFADTGGA